MLAHEQILRQIKQKKETTVDTIWQSAIAFQKTGVDCVYVLQKWLNFVLSINIVLVLLCTHVCTHTKNHSHAKSRREFQHMCEFQLLWHTAKLYSMERKRWNIYYTRWKPETFSFFPPSKQTCRSFISIPSIHPSMRICWCKTRTCETRERINTEREKESERRKRNRH